MKLKSATSTLFLVLFAMIFLVLPGCNNDEPSIPSSEHVATNLQELMNKLPMEWGMTTTETKEAMETLNLSDFHQVSSAASSIMYENETTSMYIVYGFEKSKLSAVLIMFPRQDDLDYDKLFNKYLYLGRVSEAVYADPENNRLISIHPPQLYSNYTWSAIGFTMIDDE